MTTFSKLMILSVACAACGNVTSSPPAMPWLRGFTADAVADTETAAASERLAELVGAPDEPGYGALQITTGSQTVLASYRQGLAVVDRDGHLVARAPGFDAAGSSDDLVALAAGDAGGEPVIALAVTRGGHRTSVTSIVLYRVADGRLEELFSGAVEERDGETITTGTLAFVPSGVMYRPPGAETARYIRLRSPSASPG